nr:V-set and transmembrane domain-containing protein 4 isoform X4 [Tursiops truncatus]
MVKMTKLRVVQYYGNFSRSAYRQRLRLLEERRGVLYALSVLTLRPADQGHYVCKVQEISKHRNKWTAWSNGSSATEMRVISLKASEDSSFEKKKQTWAFFEDLYVYAVLVCCVGILSVLLFTLTIIWQSVFSKRKSRVRHYLVKCPQNSSGETVTSVTSLVPLQPKKGKRRKEKADVPPAVPAKAPIAAPFHKPKLLKPQRKVALEGGDFGVDHPGAVFLQLAASQIPLDHVAVSHSVWTGGVRGAMGTGALEPPDKAKDCRRELDLC